MTLEEAFVHMTRYALEGSRADAKMLAGMTVRRAERRSQFELAQQLRELLKDHRDVRDILRAGEVNG